jgi:putative methyltransferase (TIGR04325 family)
MRGFINSVLGRVVRMLPPTAILEGYESPELIDIMFRAAVAFSPDRLWQEFAGRSAVLDFGGGFGQHYKCAIPLSPDVRWAVVESPAVVQRAVVLATPKLQFFSSVENATDWLGEPDLMHSDGALHYVPDPTRILQELCATGAKEMLWKRTLLSQTGNVEVEDQISRLDENGPRASRPSVSRKLVRYVQTRIPVEWFFAAHSNYKLVARTEDTFHFVRPP